MSILSERFLTRDQLEQILTQPAFPRSEPKPARERLGPLSRLVGSPDGEPISWRRYWFWPDFGFGIFIQALCNAIRNSSRVKPARFMSPSSVHMTLQNDSKSARASSGFSWARSIAASHSIAAHASILSVIPRYLSHIASHKKSGPISNGAASFSR